MIIHLRLILFSLGCALVFALPARAQTLPNTITAIRVEAIQSNSAQVLKVVGSDILQDKDARRFITYWNSLKRKPGSHDSSSQPIYRLWFYEDKAKFNQCAAISFESRMIFPLDPKNCGHLGDKYLFEDSSAAHDMRKMLAHLFPDFDPGANK